MSDESMEADAESTEAGTESLASSDDADAAPLPPCPRCGEP